MDCSPFTASEIMRVIKKMKSIKLIAKGSAVEDATNPGQGRMQEFSKGVSNEQACMTIACAQINF